MMDKNKLVLMIRYQINRYKAMGNGVKCQALMSELHKLQVEASASAN